MKRKTKLVINPTNIIIIYDLCLIEVLRNYRTKTEDIPIFFYNFRTAAHSFTSVSCELMGDSDKEYVGQTKCVILAMHKEHI